MSRRKRSFFDNPSPNFMVLARGVICAIWLYIVMSQLPSVLNELQGILNSMPPGSERNAALRDSAGHAAWNYIGVPFILLAMLGYGMRPRIASGLSGGSWYDAFWTPTDKPTIAKKKK